MSRRQRTGDPLQGVAASLDRCEAMMPNGWGIGLYAVRPRPDSLMQGAYLNPDRLWFCLSAARIDGVWRLAGGRMESVDYVGVLAAPTFMVESDSLDACLDLMRDRLQPV